MPFVEPLIPLFWTPGDVSSGWAALFELCRGIHVTHSLRFTSGVTSADLLAASMAAELIFSTYLQRHWWDLNTRPLAPCANTQRTELCWFGYVVCLFIVSK